MSSAYNNFPIKINGVDFQLSVDASHLQSEASVKISPLPGNNKKWDDKTLSDLQKAFYAAVASTPPQLFTTQGLQKGLQAIDATLVASDPKSENAAAAAFPHIAAAKATSMPAAGGAPLPMAAALLASEADKKDAPSKVPSEIQDILQVCERMKRNPIDIYTLSAAFHILDDGYSQMAKGVQTITEFNELSFESLDTDPETLKKAVPGEAEQYFVLAKVGGTSTRKDASSTEFTDYKIDDYFLLKMTADKVVHYFDSKMASFQVLDSEMLSKFKLQGTDLIIQLSPELEDRPAQYSLPTPTPSLNGTFGAQKGKFYHEQQTSDGKYSSLCGFHAANAFVGYRSMSLREYVAYVTDIKIENEGIDIPTAQRVRSDMNPLSGNHPYSVKEVLTRLANAGRIDPKFKHLEVSNFDSMHKQSDKIVVGCSKPELVAKKAAEWQALLKRFNEPSCDRVIVGYADSHFVTFRKTEQGRWHVIDSMVNSQTVPNQALKVQDYASIEDCLLHYGSRTPSGGMSFVYLSPEPQRAAPGAAAAAAAANGG